MKYARLFFLLVLATGLPGCSLEPEAKKTKARNAAKSPESRVKKDLDDKADAVKSPTEAVEKFVAAVKAKDEDAIKRLLSASSVKTFELMAKTQNTSFFKAVTQEDEETLKVLPEVRNETIEGDEATLELKDPKRNDWDKLKFVRVDGSWKIALFTEKEFEKMKKDLSS